MWFKKTIEDTLKELEVDPSKGLSSNEAKSRLEKYGENKLASKPKKTGIQIFMSQLKDPMIFILLVAALVSGIMGEISDAIIILLVIFINAIVGTVQESKAEKALEALKKLSTPKAIVKRDGVSTEIPSENVVPGDIIILDAGRYIPADLRLITTANMKVEESALTGESVPVEKNCKLVLEGSDIALGDQKNMTFSSTLVTYGRGTGVAVSTGMNTEIGKIAKMLDEEGNEMTPLQKKLAELGKVLGIGALAICAIMFIISVIQKRDVFEMLLTAISLAVAAIPEGLPAIVAIVLAMGVQRMIKEHAIVRKLPAVETLGSVNVICSDKTGTLTQNKMTVTKFFTIDGLKPINELDINKSSEKLLIDALVLCNDATYSKDSSTGDPTEIALLVAGNNVGMLKEELDSTYERINELPFESDRKLMTTVNKYNGENYVFTKGAVDNLLKVSTKIYINGEIKDLTDDLKSEIMESSNSMSNNALRVLSAAYKVIPNKDIDVDLLESDLIFIGLVGMIDPPRLEVKDSIAICKKSGIRTIMITGDHKNTAFAIAKELGIAENLNECISGPEIERLSDGELNAQIDNYKVFARVSPEHKVKIVKAFKSKGNTVSMTGDGVNDAPSLKAADIGVAMGITGTDVAKGAADIILTDDNFSTIVSAIEEGRNIYNNIKKSIIFLLSCNLGEIIALFIAILLAWETPLKPIHILWVNLITDTLPALSLGVDPGDKNVMDNPPRNPKESLFSGGTPIFLILNGILIGSLTLFAFKYGEAKYDTLQHAQTMAFVVLSVSQLFHSLNMRHPEKSIFQVGLFTNKYLILSIVFGIFLQDVIITVPFLANVFDVFDLTMNDWLFVGGLSIIPLVLNEISKIFIRMKKKSA
ncbi:calcium-translocating P-type ATPase, PMCA-type [Clostridium algidicarnis]|uniref:P-type Ca(2+) transporter n=1 Tax=Clostridium algidicarnis TaxID=37659 RepID=A0ABS6BZT5_9CLOT|nr:calcium-translocating P-type ATPase, PMCA-type [Clostridium algidicarnis]MBU3203509.1 calcium-translocating P-type ATPase, PMCA-type [Clostridium algidicarnis]MBU3206167.1 calcium-translocating P-type ATPase, PMCA-type [Clostridium algidicarnis]MBU3211663.1 calcium-translocating P-type ATPase, PMCA-type [Clostridium algidicarnis]MBU3218747.1 calcium-translocating P-type ATPase, PMCA-type [Clostridium algidicarnis]MBU3221829.1 calcium-translocating P-type ATPase, PMCA-type [Clostridium algid